MAQHERRALGSRHESEGGNRPLAGLVAAVRRQLDTLVSVERHRPFPPRLPAVVIEQLGARDADRPRHRHVDPAAFANLGDDGQEGLLGQVLGSRGRAAEALEQVPWRRGNASS